MYFLQKKRRQDKTFLANIFLVIKKNNILRKNLKIRIYVGNIFYDTILLYMIECQMIRYDFL